MIFGGGHDRPRFLAPEVVQTSVMDCGPAALKCLLEGFGVPTSYARLQEACQTDIDGTSINTIEQIAVALGLDAEQVMVPVDHVLLRSARLLPALVVVRRESMTHFLVAWRRHGPFVQVMDPAKGRRWLRLEPFKTEVYVHQQRVPTNAWREYAASSEFLAAVSERLAGVGIRGPMADRLVRDATDDDTWRSLAALDASTRLVADLGRAGGLRGGEDAGRLVMACAKRAVEDDEPYATIPANYWSVVPAAGVSPDESLVLRGAVMLRVRARVRAAESRVAEPAPASKSLLPKSLTRALNEAPSRPLSHVWHVIRRDGIVTPAILAGALVLVTVGALFEILLLRGFLEAHNVLTLREHRLVAVGLLVAFVGALLVMELAVTNGVLRIGRRLEARLRAALLEKLPKIGDRYFHSRLVADMAHRAHSLDALRNLPDLGADVTRASLQLVLTAVGIAWLDLPSAWIAGMSALLALSIPLLTASMLNERELRQRSHAAALSRHYLDSLLGLVAARTHGAERALRQRHDALLVEWGRSSVHLLRGGVVVEGLQTLVGYVLAAWLVLDFASRGNQPGSTLLLVYWALNLPVLGKELAGIVQQLPAYRNIVYRLLEPLSAPEESSGAPAPADPDSGPVAIRFDQVQVQVAGRPVLAYVDLAIDPGEHVAIVGRSGAGKSTLIGLLLGWRAPTQGAITVDDDVLDGSRLVELRRETAWVDPAVQLWNRSFFDNLRYGDPTTMISNVGSLLETSQLIEVLEKLPAGLQSSLGEGGRLTSGGEGQRIRFARALARPDVRLALLDEPFRGLERDRRRELLARARQVWRGATLLCVTHDIDETLTFPRVLVIDEGRIVEDGDPAVLAKTAGSLYAHLLAAEEAVKTTLWAGEEWRRWRLERGTLTEDGPLENPWKKQHASPGQ